MKAELATVVKCHVSGGLIVLDFSQLIGEFHDDRGPVASVAMPVEGWDVIVGLVADTISRHQAKQEPKP